jgi:hypothetical protein
MLFHDMTHVRLSLVPGTAGAVHVRAGGIVRVIASHEVETVTRPAGALEVPRLDGVDDRPVLPLPTGPMVTAQIGDLAIELVSVTTGSLIGHAYVAGPAAQLHNHRAMVAWFEPARVERLSKVDRAVEEIGCEASQERIAELQDLCIAELQRVRHGDVDIALLDIEVGDGFKQAARAFEQMWTNYEATPPRPAGERTCHLIGAVVRNRKIARSMHRKNLGAAYLHFQPPKHAGWPSATVFAMQLLLGAGLAS